jgi:hypothetical protein
MKAPAKRAADFGLIELIDQRTNLPIYQGTPGQFIASGLLTKGGGAHD